MLAGANLSGQFAADIRGVEALRMKAVAGDPATLRTVAREFEAMLVQTMLKTARSSSLAGDGDVFGNSSDMKLYKELLDQQWAQNLTAGKGLGFADILVKRFGMNVAADGAAAPSKGTDTADTAAKALTLAPETLRNAAAPAESQLPAGTTDTLEDSSGGRGEDRSSWQDRKARFIQAMLPHAQAAEQATGVPARFMLAQAALESGWGQREIRLDDGGASHNLFGIKASSGWDGQAVNAVTTEYKQGLAMKVTAKFRAYADYAEAFIDYAKLLKRRYHGVIEAGNDAQAFVRSIVSGGYATDPAYGDKLQGTIRSIGLVGV